MVIRNSIKTCSSLKKFKIFTDFHIFSRESESGSRLPTFFWGLGVGVAQKMSRLDIPDIYGTHFTLSNVHGKYKQGHASQPFLFRDFTNSPQSIVRNEKFELKILFLTTSQGRVRTPALQPLVIFNTSLAL